MSLPGSDDGSRSPQTSSTEAVSLPDNTGSRSRQTSGAAAGTLASSATLIAGKLSAAQVAELVGTSLDQVRAWVRAGLLQPVGADQGNEHFDFQQVVGARRIGELIGSGLPPAQARRGLRQIRDWLDKTGEPLAAVQETAGRLLGRRDDGLLADTGGQLYFDFAEGTAITAGQLRPGPTAEQWFEQGFAHEEAGRLAESAAAYRQALLAGGPNAETSYNLGNVLLALGSREAAAERYRQAVEVEPNHAAAWNNLGAVLEELGDAQGAEAAYEAAVKACPGFPDARYNLADLLDKSGRRAEAARHWEAYLRLEATGAWAQFARRKLREYGTG
jgi:tetratricopeptide (TPR) repeat protein